MLRRHFLVLAGAAATIPILSDAAEKWEKGGASTRTRLFVGCCALSFKKYLDAGSMTMEDFFRKAVELGVHGVDVTTYWLKSKEPEYLTSLRHLAFENGLCFSGAAIATVMCQSDPVRRAEEVRSIQQGVDATQWLGASHLRVFGGRLPPDATEKQGIEWVAETWKAAAEYSAKYGITLGMENHHGITGRASALLEILHRVGSPYVGINLDISNFDVESDEQQYADIEACVPYATHVHVRDHFSQTHKPIDLDRAWQILAKGGYKGFASAEHEGEEDPSTAVPKLLDKIKGLCAKYSSA
jgi:sugar phosphate isomerase/epimerase